MKTCNRCKREHDAASWAALPYVGIQHSEDETGRYELTLKNCPCGSTLGVEEQVTQ
jgi:hypothetical protein